MGLFSKKEYVCEKCGKVFSKRLNLNGNLCDDCSAQEYNERLQLESSIQGYVQYGQKVLHKDYSIDEMRKILQHRNSILEKYRNTGGISKNELKEASDNYKRLSDDEARSVWCRAMNSGISNTIGAAYTAEFFAPTNYSGMIVDASDIFAVGFTTDASLNSISNEAILCAVFTNDPYVPVFPVIYSGKISFFELTKSKKGRADVVEMFTTMCPNLTYPVGDLKQLKKQIVQEEKVRGNIDKKFMLGQIKNASISFELFDTKKMGSYLNIKSAEMLDEIGYIQRAEINSILCLDSRSNRNYWKKQAEKLM